ncbi:restriction endonuclease subunit S [Lactobacillus gallinarum]|uniref:restriction endonuclease subunit S n=1 Tax=Lactobacillus gallinarum TaxID=52242 RepID=UPI0024B1AD99|nr:restriction endonuclease subunit S [Lactobacillus gallinarum]
MKTNTLDFDAQALRDKILDLAMRGKLVKQDPNDEPASELLKKIKAEKAELIKERKIKKSKPLPPITDNEKPFDLPDSWEWVRLEEVGSVKNGKTPKKEDINSQGPYPYFKVKDMNNNRLYMNKVESYVDEKYKNQLLPKNTIIFPKNGGAVLTAKKRILIQASLVDLNTGGLVPNSNINCKYLFYLFKSLNIKDYVKGSAVPTINSKKLKETVVPLPPLSEQSRIAAKIAQLFALLRKVESSTQQYAKLQTLLKSKVLDLAMRGKLVKQDPNDEPASELLKKIKAEKAELIKERKIKKSKPLPPITDNEKPFDIPDSWEWVRLGEITKKITDGTHNPPPNAHLGKQIISAVNIKNGKIDFKLSDRFVTNLQFEKEDKRTHIRRGDILFTIVGSLGNAAIVETDKMFTAQRSVAIINSDLPSKYLYYSLISKMFQEQIFNNAKGTTQKGIYLKKLSGLVLPLPPLKEQGRIVNKVNKLSKIM